MWKPELFGPGLQRAQVFEIWMHSDINQTVHNTQKLMYAKFLFCKPSNEPVTALKLIKGMQHIYGQ